MLKLSAVSARFVQLRHFETEVSQNVHTLHISGNGRKLNLNIMRVPLTCDVISEVLQKRR